jgi:hypothetical protein
LNIRPSMRSPRISLSLMVLIFLFPVWGCKKSPLTPDAASLTRPVIWLDSFELNFAASETGPNPLSQILKIKNAGQSTLKYDITSDQGWVKIEPADGTSSGQVNAHTVNIDKTGLAAQEADYEATITVACSEAYNNPQRAKVNLKISEEPPPKISVSPQSLSFAAQTGSNPPRQILAISNIGGGTLSYAITWDSSWLSVSPQSGTSTGQKNSHTVSVQSSSLPAGVYDALIIITGPDAANSPQEVGVTLRVGAIPTNNEIRVSCNPSEGRTGATISVPVSIVGNLNEIAAFGFELTFDPNMFQYIGTSKGSLTGSWTYIDGNANSGIVIVGGLSGAGNPIPVGSAGTIAIVTFRVTGGSYSDGQQSQITIRNYADDLAGLRPEPAATTFTYRQ